MFIPDCKKHPKYQAKRQPRTLCFACWRKYILQDYKHYSLER